MSAPRRWKDAPDAPVGMRELLGGAGGPRAFDEAARRRGAERVARLGAAPAAAVAVVSIWTKLAAAGVLAASAVGTVVVVSAHRADALPVVAAPLLASPATPVVAPTPRPAAEPEPATPTVAVVAPPPPPAPAAPPARAREATAPPVEPAPAPTNANAAPSTLADELSLLESARADLARDPDTALALVRQHRARFPSGVLAAERDLLELDALRRTGRVQDARTAAEAWLTRDAEGLHAPRVRAILATLPAVTPR